MIFFRGYDLYVILEVYKLLSIGMSLNKVFYLDSKMLNKYNSFDFNKETINRPCYYEK